MRVYFKIILFLFIPILSFGQGKIITIGTKAPDSDKLNGQVSSYYIDSASSQSIYGEKNFQGSICIGDTIGFVLSGDSATINTKTNVILDTEGGASADTLAVLVGSVGQIVYISTRNSARDIAIMDADKFSLGANRILNNSADVLVLKATSTTEWKEISFSNNGN